MFDRFVGAAIEAVPGVRRDLVVADDHDLGAVVEQAAHEIGDLTASSVVRDEAVEHELTGLAAAVVVEIVASAVHDQQPWACSWPHPGMSIDS